MALKILTLLRFRECLNPNTLKRRKTTKTTIIFLISCRLRNGDALFNTKKHNHGKKQQNGKNTMALPSDLLNCYFFNVSLQNSGICYSTNSLENSSSLVAQLHTRAQAGDVWVDPANNRKFDWLIIDRKCSNTTCTIDLTAKKRCSCRKFLVFTMVLETRLDSIELCRHTEDDYAFLGNEIKKRMAYEFSRTKSRKQTFFFINETNRQHMFDAIGQSPAASASKAANDSTANWLPFYQQFGHLGADDLFHDLERIQKNVRVPFVYVVLLGKHRRQDRTRYLLFEKPDERLDVAQKRAQRMFKVQCKGKSKKAFSAELLARVDRMNALWPARMPTWAPFLETCIMLEFSVGIVTI